MTFEYLFKNKISHFAKLGKEHGWTEKETMEIIEAVHKEIKNNIFRNRGCNVDSILKKHAMPVIERKRREQKQQKNNEL